MLTICFLVSASPGDNIHIHVTPRMPRRKTFIVINLCDEITFAYKIRVVSALITIKKKKHEHFSRFCRTFKCQLTKYGQ